MLRFIDKIIDHPGYAENKGKDDLSLALLSDTVNVSIFYYL